MVGSNKKFCNYYDNWKGIIMTPKLKYSIQMKL